MELGAWMPHSEDWKIKYLFKFQIPNIRKNIRFLKSKWNFNKIMSIGFTDEDCKYFCVFRIVHLLIMNILYNK